MRIPSTPRRAGARSKPVQFSYVSTERGQPYEAYLAGPVWWGYLHMTRPSKPCVYEMTGGTVCCRFCNPKFIAVVKGWVPLYRRLDGLAVCVPVDEALRDELDGLKTFSKVAVGRGKGKGVGVWVRATLEQTPEWSSTLPERKEPADITESLIRMWGVQEVVDYFGSVATSDNAESLVKSPALTSQGEEFGGMTSAAAQKYAAPTPPDANETFAAGVNRIRDRGGVYDAKPGTNGNHKPKG